LPTSHLKVLWISIKRRLRFQTLKVVAAINTASGRCDADTEIDLTMICERASLALPRPRQDRDVRRAFTAVRPAPDHA
jgi:hypothetical protein